MIIERIWPGNAWRNFHYLIACSETGEAMAVDPLDWQSVHAAAQRNGWTITHILNTHEHGDHIGGNDALRAAFAGLAASDDRERARLADAADKIAGGNGRGRARLRRVTREDREGGGAGRGVDSDGRARASAERQRGDRKPGEQGRERDDAMHGGRARHQPTGSPFAFHSFRSSSSVMRSVTVPSASTRRTRMPSLSNSWTSTSGDEPMRVSSFQPVVVRDQVSRRCGSFWSRWSKA